MSAGIKNLLQIASRIDAPFLQHLARENVARGREGVAEREGLAAQIVQSFNAAVRSGDDGGIIKRDPFTLRFQNDFDIGFVFREYIGRWRQKSNVELVHPQGFDDAGIIGGDKRLNFHAQLFPQDVHQRLSILHDLLGVFSRHKADAERLWTAATLAAGKSAHRKNHSDTDGDPHWAHRNIDTECAWMVQSLSVQPIAYPFQRTRSRQLSLIS